jgi:hypothetical protein
MSTICNPVKLTPPPAKKGRPSINWQRCIICQVFTAERLCIPTTKGWSTVISAVNKRRMKFTENLLTNIQLSKMLHLEIPNITKAVAKHMSVSKTCHDVPTLNPHV